MNSFMFTDRSTPEHLFDGWKRGSQIATRINLLGYLAITGIKTPFGGNTR